MARMLMKADGAGLEARTVDERTPPPIEMARLSNVLSGVSSARDDIQLWN